MYFENAKVGRVEGWRETKKMHRKGGDSEKWEPLMVWIEVLAVCKTFRHRRQPPKSTQLFKGFLLIVLYITAAVNLLSLYTHRDTKGFYGGLFANITNVSGLVLDVILMQWKTRQTAAVVCEDWCQWCVKYGLWTMGGGLGWWCNKEGSAKIKLYIHVCLREVNAQSANT